MFQRLLSLNLIVVFCWLGVVETHATESSIPPMLNWVAMQVLSSEGLPPDVRQVFNETLRSKHVRIEHLTDELRLKLKLPPDADAVQYSMKYARVTRDPSVPMTGLNSLLSDPPAGLFDDSQMNIVVPDVLQIHFSRRPTLVGSASQAIQLLAHELAHAHLNMILNALADTIYNENWFSRDLFFKTDSGYHWHPDLHNFIHEQYAYRIGYKAMLHYLVISGEAPMQPLYYDAVGPAPIQYDTIPYFEKVVPLALYGVRDPRVLEVVGMAKNMGLRGVYPAQFIGYMTPGVLERILDAYAKLNVGTCAAQLLPI